MARFVVLERARRLGCTPKIRPEGAEPKTFGFHAREKWMKGASRVLRLEEKWLSTNHVARVALFLQR
jgi:hypothetical protein